MLARTHSSEGISVKISLWKWKMALYLPKNSRQNANGSKRIKNNMALNLIMPNVVLISQLGSLAQIILYKVHTVKSSADTLSASR